MRRAKDAVGAYGERVAISYLVDHGMELIERNWRCRAGEIDAVLSDRGTVVFVEVKTRRSEAFGTPAEAIGYRKRARLQRLAMMWLIQSDHPYVEVRFDIVSVFPQRGGAARVEHIPAAF